MARQEAKLFLAAASATGRPLSRRGKVTRFGRWGPCICPPTRCLTAACLQRGGSERRPSATMTAEDHLCVRSKNEAAEVDGRRPDADGLSFFRN